MNPIRCLLLLPALALCGSYSGIVTSLDGTPLVGAVVKVGSDSTVTTTSGFALTGTTGLVRRASGRDSRSIRFSLEQGRLRQDIRGRDVSGRRRDAFGPTDASGEGIESGASAVAARSAAVPETLSVFWNGKRLVVLPVPADTSVALRIDTAWGDDAGIPWNPRATYGTLMDVRDGRSYRTVKIGTQTWMAQNLAFAVDPGTASWVYRDSARYAERYGRLYTWAASMGLPAGCDRAICSTQVVSRRGACPAGWHVPSMAEWDLLRTTVEAAEDIGVDRGARALKSRTGWYDGGGGDDRYGFRLVPSGWVSGSAYRMADTITYIRVSDEYEADRSWDMVVTSSSIVEWLNSYYYYKWQGLSLRCLEDTP